MNHHLRFLVSTVATALIALALSSCSSNSQPEDPPKPPLRSGEIRYSFHLFTTDEILDVTNSFPDSARIAGIYSEAEGIKLLNRYRKNEDFHLEHHNAPVGRNAQKVRFSSFTNFRHPTEYDPPKYHKDQKNKEIFPVTPSTPTTFKTKKMGTMIQFAGQRAGDDQISLSLNLDRASFLGNYNFGTPITAIGTNFWGRKVPIVITENKMFMPVFRDFKLDSKITLRNRQFLLIEGSTRPPSRKLDKSTGPVVAPNFVALIQVEAAP